MGVTIDAEQGLYIVPNLIGYTTLSFDYVYMHAKGIFIWHTDALAEMNELGEYVKSAEEYDSIFERLFPRKLIGTLEGYRIYEHWVRTARMHCEAFQTLCPIDLCYQLIGQEGKMVEVEEHSGEIRRFMVKRIGGWMPCHIEGWPDSMSGMPVTGAPFKRVYVFHGREKLLVSTTEAR